MAEQSPEARLYDAVMNQTTIEEDVEAARQGWAAAASRRYRHGTDDASARVRLLDGQVAYLQHVVADLMALVDTTIGMVDSSREDLGRHTAHDLVLGGYRYATATLSHGAPPEFDWLHHAVDACPHPVCAEVGAVHDGDSPSAIGLLRAGGRR